MPPDRPGDLAAIHLSNRVPIATAEHECTRWGFVRLLVAEAVSVVEADSNRCVGISESTKICTVASTFGRRVGLHDHLLPAALQVNAAQTPTLYPMAEHLVRMQPIAEGSHRAPLQPEGDALPLPTKPGVGIELGEAKIEEKVEPVWATRPGDACGPRLGRRRGVIRLGRSLCRPGLKEPSKPRRGLSTAADGGCSPGVPISSDASLPGS